MRRDDADAVELDEFAKTPWSGAWTAAGVIALLEPLASLERCNTIQKALSQRLDSVTLLLDGAHDPHNVAAVLRSCDAFGLQQVHVASSGASAGAFSAASSGALMVSRKIAQGTERWVDVTHHAQPSDAVSALRAERFVLAAAHPQGKLMPEDLVAIPRVAIVLGNEHSGISAEVSLACEHTVRIPMRGFVESLNLSVSAALLIRAATMARAGDLSETQKQHLYARGLWRSVNRAAEILAASEPH
ncbi:MAG TPA: RNA methyltransferase [Polyangiaceae bacterium]|nr:RNA methyltransferase [Polyangiaceae bacterium]